MNSIVVDVETFTGGIVKEIGIYRNGTCLGLSFTPPFDFYQLEEWDQRQCRWLTTHLHKMDWTSGETPYE